jgi:hypothetical protein
MAGKYKQVKINLKPEEYDRIEAAAEEDGVTKAEWIRRRIGAEIDEEDRRSRRSSVETKAADPRLLYELNRIGNNLNQIATRSNANKAVDREVLTALLRIETEVKELP